mgnify:CR=1 FL=1
MLNVISQVHFVFAHMLRVIGYMHFDFRLYAGKVIRHMQGRFFLLISESLL